MAVVLEPLPYAKDALEPTLSAETLEYHHDKHQNAYVVKLNELIAGTPLQEKSLDEIIKDTMNDPAKAAIFNQAAQVWNHTFYWKCMQASGGGKPTGVIADKINQAFGDYDNFAKEFKNAAVTQFGSGWAWLVSDDKGNLSIMKTANADLPMAHGLKALLTCDVWEHAYYIDYRNRRPDYAQAFLDKLVNWDYVTARLEGKADSVVS